MFQLGKDVISSLWVIIDSANNYWYHVYNIIYIIYMTIRT